MAVPFGVVEISPPVLTELARQCQSTRGEVAAGLHDLYDMSSR